MAGIIAQVGTPYCGLTCLPAYSAFFSDNAGSYTVRKHEMRSHTRVERRVRSSALGESLPSPRLPTAFGAFLTRAKSSCKVKIGSRRKKKKKRLTLACNYKCNFPNISLINRSCFYFAALRRICRRFTVMERATRTYSIGLSGSY